MAIQINFDNPLCTFRPGECVSGYVTISTSSEVEATGLTLSFHGNGFVRWTERERSTRRRSHGLHINATTNSQMLESPALPNPNIAHPHIHDHHIHYENAYETRVFRNEETYFTSTIELPLYSSQETSVCRNPSILQAGYLRHIPFTFILPVGIPSSCKLEHGGVNYFAEACLKIKHTILVLSIQKKETFKKEFYILGNLELALIYGILTPVHEQCQKQFRSGFCCCFGSSGEGEFKMELRLAKKGFIAGEPIVFNLNLANDSPLTVKDVKVSLDQSIQYLTIGKENVCSTRLGTVDYRENVVPGSSYTWTNELRVPLNAHLSDLGGCRIIHVKYLLMVVAKASMCRQAKIEIPITIGTVSPSQVPLVPVFREF